MKITPEGFELSAPEIKALVAFTGTDKKREALHNVVFDPWQRRVLASDGGALVMVVAPEPPNAFAPGPGAAARPEPEPFDAAKLPREKFGVLPDDLAAAAKWPLVKRFPLLVPFTRAALGGVSASATEDAGAKLLLSCMGTTALVARYEGDFNDYDRIVPDKTDMQSDVIQEFAASYLAKLPLVVNALDRPRSIETGMRLQCNDGIGLIRLDCSGYDGTEWTVVIAPRRSK